MFRAKTVYVHLYKIFLFIFSARRYIALTASAKFRIPMGNSKIARNEQVCAHQKSYRRNFFPHLFSAVVYMMDCLACLYGSGMPTASHLKGYSASTAPNVWVAYL